jgi:hypothetical protein
MNSRNAVTISARIVRIARCRLERSQRCRWSIRKSTPCSFGEIGNGSATETMTRSESPSSTPPGERASARSVPRTTTADSWLSWPNDSQASAETSRAPATHCTSPEPSRTTRNWILPLERRCATQPRISTTWPT